MNNRTYLDKNDLINYTGWFVFTHGLHIGLARMASQYFECVTLECSENTTFSRWLSFFDDKLLIVNKIERDKIQNEIERIFNELI